MRRLCSPSRSPPSPSARPPAPPSSAPGWTYAAADAGPVGRCVRVRCAQRRRVGRSVGQRLRRAQRLGRAPVGASAAPARPSSSRPPTSRSSSRAVTAPADTAFTIALRQQGGRARTTSRSRTRRAPSVFKGDIVTGPATERLPGPGRSPPAPTPFVCTVHPNMTGTLTRRLPDPDRRGQPMTPRRRASATATPTRASCQARVLEVVGGGRRAARRPRRDDVLPGRRRPALGPRASSCGPPTAGAGRSGPRGASAARSSTSSRRPRTASCPRAGDGVTVDLDWARRYALMRTHTALHALCGVVWRDYGALVTGGNMEPGAGPDGLRVRADVGRPRRRDRGRRVNDELAPPARRPGRTSCRGPRRSRSRT